MSDVLRMLTGVASEAPVAKRRKGAPKQAAKSKCSATTRTPAATASTPDTPAATASAPALTPSSPVNLLSPEKATKLVSPDETAATPEKTVFSPGGLDSFLLGIEAQSRELLRDSSPEETDKMLSESLKNVVIPPEKLSKRELFLQEAICAETIYKHLHSSFFYIKVGRVETFSMLMCMPVFMLLFIFVFVMSASV